jgi:hypothetical protein
MAFDENLAARIRTALGRKPSKRTPVSGRPPFLNSRTASESLAFHNLRRWLTPTSVQSVSSSKKENLLRKSSSGGRNHRHRKPSRCRCDCLV